MQYHYYTDCNYAIYFSIKHTFNAKRMWRKIVGKYNDILGKPALIF